MAAAILELLTAPTFFVLHIAPFQGYHTMQISIRVSIVQVLSRVVVGAVIPKMGNCDFWACFDQGAEVKIRTLQTAKGSAPSRVSVVL
jgi:hypothetical protein